MRLLALVLAVAALAVPAAWAAGPRPASGARDLPRMALTLADLPAGSAVERQGYVKDKDTVASYEREFEVARVVIGRSKLTSLENDISLYGSDSEAGVTFAAITAVFTAKGAAGFLASSFAEGGGFTPTAVKVERVTRLHLGDGAWSVSVGFGTPIGRVRAVYAYVHVGRTIGALTVSGPASTTRAADALPLLRKLAARMASASRP